jgi:hypothetical protein
MMNTRMAFVALAFAALTLGLGGCSKSPRVQDICEKLAPPEEVAECTAELTRELDQCSNRDDVLKCMDEAPNERGAESCFAQCQTEGGE